MNNKTWDKLHDPEIIRKAAEGANKDQRELVEEYDISNWIKIGKERGYFDYLTSKVNRIEVINWKHDNK